MKSGLLSLMVALLCPAVALAQHQHSPYAALQDRDIKALSPDEIDDYLNGDGMGMALPAELNGYPGPRHALELAAELGLSEAQVEAARAIFDSMKREAMELGTEIVALERELDREFAVRTVTAEALDSLTSRIGRLQSSLRSVHLRAHLELGEVLTDAQRLRYYRLRGYAGH